jgi:MFS family permease
MWAGLPRSVQVLIVARAVNRLGAFTLPFLTPLLTQRLHVSIAGAGLMLAGFGAATIPSRLFGGRLTDRLGVRATIVVGLGGTAAAQLGLAAARSPAQAAIAVVVLGLAFEIYEPAGQSMIADVVPAGRRPEAYGLLTAAMAAAGVGAGLLAASVAGFGLGWLFVIDAGTGLACAVVVVLALPAGLPAARREQSRGVDARLVAMLVAGTVFAIVYLQTTVALPLTLAARGQPAARLGLLLTASALTIVLGRPLLRIRARDDFSAMAVGYLILSIGLLALGFSSSLLAFIAAMVTCAIGDLLLLGRAYSVVVSLAPPGARGRYLAVYGVSWGIAAVVAPIVGTETFAYAGQLTLWTGCATAALALAAAQPWLRRMAGVP